MNWIPLTSEDQLLHIVTISSEKPQVIFKHSTRCSTSSMILNRLERSESSDAVDFYFLDLIQYRSISAKISEMFHVAHESPQVLVIKNGTCTFDESHFAISMDEILEQSVLKHL
jgi:bacillithiol system protein YtxJ